MYQVTKFGVPGPDPKAALLGFPHGGSTVDQPRQTRPDQTLQPPGFLLPRKLNPLPAMG